MTDNTSLPPDDPVVTQVVDQAMSIHSQLATNAQITDDGTQSVAQSDNTSGKSPLDILEEILQKEKSSHPDVVEKTPEEIATHQAQLKAEQDKQIEAQRQRLLQEVQSPEQHKRDDIRKQQADELANQKDYHIPQLQHSKVWVEENG